MFGKLISFVVFKRQKNMLLLIYSVFMRWNELELTVIIQKCKLLDYPKKITKSYGFVINSYSLIEFNR